MIKLFTVYIYKIPFNARSFVCTFFYKSTNHVALIYKLNENVKNKINAFFAYKVYIVPIAIIKN